MTSADRRSALYRCFGLAAEVAAGVTPAQLTGPTVCKDYGVATLIDHLVGAGHRVAVLGRGETPGAEEFPHVDLADAPGQLRQAGVEAEAGWSDDARLVATTTMPWGEAYSGATLVDMYLAELATHTWDLAEATGQSLTSSDLAEVALEGAKAMLRPEYRNMMGEGNPFGSELDPPPGADAWDRLAAFMGRRPAR